MAQASASSPHSSGPTSQPLFSTHHSSSSSSSPSRHGVVDSVTPTSGASTTPTTGLRWSGASSANGAAYTGYYANNGSYAQPPNGSSPTLSGSSGSSGSPNGGRISGGSQNGSHSSLNGLSLSARHASSTNNNNSNSFYLSNSTNNGLNYNAGNYSSHVNNGVMNNNHNGNSAAGLVMNGSAAGLVMNGSDAGLVCYDIAGRPMSALRRPDHVGLLGICQQGGAVVTEVKQQKRVRFNDAVSEVPPTSTPTANNAPTTASSSSSSSSNYGAGKTGPSSARSLSNTSLGNGLGPLWENDSNNNHVTGNGAENHPGVEASSTAPVGLVMAPMTCGAQSRMENGAASLHHHPPPHHPSPGQMVEVEGRNGGREPQLAPPPGTQLMKKTVRYSRHYQGGS